MADVKMIATRESYGNTLKALAAEGHDDLVVLDADLAAATKTGVFRKAHPDRHFDCGIAEANMMGVAAGLSTMGYVPFVSSFAMFAAGRAFEQIRNSVAYPHLNVKIGATHGGISVGEDGASHQCCEDFALMRSLPGMTIICPADDVEARAAVRAAYEMQGPVYLRFGRLAVPVFHDEANYHFEIGKGEQLTEGSDIAIVATGLMVNEARKAAETLAAEGIHARVINIHTIKPLDEDIILKAAKECGKIVTAEEHNVIGGLGEAVCSLLSEKLPTPVRRVGVQDKFGCSGPAWDLLKQDRKGNAGQVSSFSEITNAAVHCTAAFFHLTELLSAFPSRRTPRRRPCAGCISRGGGHPAGSAGGCPGGTDAAGCATRRGRPGISSGRGTSPARPAARRRPTRSFPPSARPVWNRASPACTSPATSRATALPPSTPSA